MTFAMLVMWILGGLLAGGVAGFVLKRGGYGRTTDIALALSGALVGCLIFGSPEISPEGGFFAMAVVAFGGAAAAIILQRKLWPMVA